MSPIDPKDLEGIQSIEEDTELTSQIEKQMEDAQKQSEKLAQRYMRKNAREIKRLNKHASNCLIEGNKAGYMYAIGKLRRMIGQSVSDDVLESLWKTSREEVLKIAASFTEAKYDASGN